MTLSSSCRSGASGARPVQRPWTVSCHASVPPPDRVKVGGRSILPPVPALAPEELDAMRMAVRSRSASKASTCTPSTAPALTFGSSDYTGLIESLRREVAAGNANGNRVAAAASTTSRSITITTPDGRTFTSTAATITSATASRSLASVGSQASSSGRSAEASSPSQPPRANSSVTYTTMQRKSSVPSSPSSVPSKPPNPTPAPMDEDEQDWSAHQPLLREVPLPLIRQPLEQASPRQAAVHASPLATPQSTQATKPSSQSSVVSTSTRPDSSSLLPKQVQTDSPRPQQQRQQAQRQPQQQLKTGPSGSARDAQDFKGLSVPIGPKYSRFRARLWGWRAAAQGLPHLDALVVVEGETDAWAVQRAVNAPVFALNGSRIKADFAEAELEALRSIGVPLIVLTDPDMRGRELRVFLDDNLAWSRAAAQKTAGQGPSVRHAFVPATEATSTRSNKRHEQGNVGVEHASPSTLQRVLGTAAPGYGPGRTEFTNDELMALGLVNAFNAMSAPGAKERRQQVCNSLGLDACTGSALVTMLNRFFTRQQFEAALKAVAPPSSP